jgi:hypothetical protein
MKGIATEGPRLEGALGERRDEEYSPWDGRDDLHLDVNLHHRLATNLERKNSERKKGKRSGRLEFSSASRKKGSRLEEKQGTSFLPERT